MFLTELQKSRAFFILLLYISLIYEKGGNIHGFL